MKLLLLLTATLVGGAPGSGAPLDELRVLATIPDLADIAREVGGERVEVKALAKGTMNIHAVPLRPSSLVAASRADLFLEMGLSLEHAYVPSLLMQSRNEGIQPGAPGFVNCSEGWEPLDVPAAVDRGVAADIHPLGNPHWNLDPRAGEHMADAILAGLVRVDARSRATYEARHAAYLGRVAEARTRWDVLREEMQGGRIVTYHTDFAYFARYFGLEIVSSIESRPGVPPTANDLKETIDAMRSTGCEVILTAKWSFNKNVRFVAEKTGARVVEVPTMVGGVPDSDTWIEMMDVLTGRVASALAKKR